MTKNNITAIDILTRYTEEDLPEFVGIDLLNVNQVGIFGNSPLHIASTRGDPLEVSLLIKGGADVNALGELGNTALHDAVGQQKTNIVKMLLDAGADIKIQNEFGETPLDVATRKNIDEILTLLKEYSKS